MRLGCGQHQPLSRSGLSEELGGETWHASGPETLLSSSSKRQEGQTLLPTELGQTGARQCQRTRKLGLLRFGFNIHSGEEDLGVRGDHKLSVSKAFYFNYFLFLAVLGLPLLCAGFL